MFSVGIPRVINLLCEHSLISAYAQQKRLIEPEGIQEVAREFQLDEVEPVASPGSLHAGSDVYTSEAFIQNLGHALCGSGSSRRYRTPEEGASKRTGDKA